MSKILIIAQKIDLDDPVLGFFHSWIKGLSKYYEKTTAIGLSVGRYDLTNIKVLSLGKESGESRIKYIKNFYKYIWQERENYDSVFVHMNEEYPLLGGWLWKLLGKKVYMWRNHHAGSVRTDIAAIFCNNVFCTSKFSYTAKYKKTILMPVGVDLENFDKESQVSMDTKGNRNIDKNNLLFLGRISETKRADLFIEGIKKLNADGVKATGDIYGSPPTGSESYYERLKKDAPSYIRFYPGTKSSEAPAIFLSHYIFVNLSSNGMYDKTIFEAMISGCLVVVSNDNLIGQIPDDFIFKQGDTDELVLKIQKLLKYSPQEVKQAIDKLKSFARGHSLQILIEKLSKIIK